MRVSVGDQHPTCGCTGWSSWPAERGYDRWTIGQLDRTLREDTARTGLWLDTSDLTVDAVVDEILARRDEALVVPG
jgi:hypothetical protein